MIRIGIDYYPEQWDRSLWDEDLRAMAEMGVHAVRIGEFAWSRLEPSDGEFDLAWLDDIIGLVAGHGMQIILGTPTNCPPQWLIAAHPDVLRWDTTGRMVANPQVRGHRCQNSPTFRAYAARIVRVLAERYAGRPEVLAWQIDNEVEPNRCTCPSCAEAFRTWVRRRHGSLEALNDAWGTVVWSGEISDWGQVRPLMLNEHSRRDWYNPAYVLDHERFCSQSMADYIDFQTRIIKECDPNAIVTTNAFVGPRPYDYFVEFGGLDVAGFDNYPPLSIPDDPEATYSNAFVLDLVRGFKSQNFWVLEQLGGPMGCWQPITRAMEPGMLEGYALQAVAHGADLLSFFRWRTATTGAEMFCYGLLDHDNKRNRRIEELEQLTRRLRALPGLSDTTLSSQVALVYSPDSAADVGGQTGSEGYDYWRALRKLHDACMNLGVNVDVIREDAELDGYRVVVLAGYAVVSDGLVGNLERLVANGGIAVVTNRSGLKDQNGNCVLGERKPVGLADLCGVHVLEFDPIGDATQTIVGRGGGWDGTVYDVTEWCDVLATDGAEVVAEYVGRFYQRTPAITCNRHGQGVAYYVGCTGGKALCRALMAEACREAGVPTHDGLPSGVEHTVRSGAGGTYGFLFNNTLQEQSFVWDTESLRMRPLEVRILPEGPHAEGSPSAGTSAP